MNAVFYSMLAALFSCSGRGQEYKSRSSRFVTKLAALQARTEKALSFEWGLPVALAVALAHLDGMALSIGHSQSGHGDRLAAKRFPTFIGHVERGRRGAPWRQQELRE